MLGDWEITLSGNVFTERDRSFFLDLMSLVHRRGFNSFVRGLEVNQYGVDPRHELPNVATERADVSLAVSESVTSSASPVEWEAKECPF